jgi:hypothetical protein
MPYYASFPLSPSLTEGNLLIDFPRNKDGYDYKKINFPIVYCILTSQAIAAFLQSNVEAGLIDGVLDFGLEDFRDTLKT